jgi:phage terminase large subunit-like protein
MLPKEREDLARAHFEAFINEEICPNLLGNRWIPSVPTPPQAHFLGMHSRVDTAEVSEGLYGGAAGGGKSEALLMGAAQYVEEPTFAGIMFRRTHTDLAQPGALMDRAMGWWIPAGAHWDGMNKIFRFPSGAKVAMAYLSKPFDHLRYQGAEYQYTAWDELTQWPTSAQYEYVGLSRVRRVRGVRIPLRTLSATNPGGPGHDWVRERFIGGVDPLTGETVPALRPFVPARIADNPHLDQEAYVRGLMMLHPTERARLLAGDWDAREPGDYFRREWFGPLLDPEVDKYPAADSIRVRWWDLAASEKPGAAKTAGGLMAAHRSGVRAVEHCVSFRLTPGRRDDVIVQTAQADGHGVVVGIEIEGGSGGIAQFLALEKKLKEKGFRVAGARPRADLTDEEADRLVRNPMSMTGKEGRAAPVASCLERGYQRRGEGADTGGTWFGADLGRKPHEERDGLRLFAGPWTSSYLSILEGFPEGATCDEVDATSGGWAYLEAHAIQARIPWKEKKEAAPLITDHTIHPEDRPKGEAGRPGKGRHWAP